VNYGEMTCHWCGRCFEELPFWATCSACYSSCEDVRRVVDEAYPLSANKFVPTMDDMTEVA
jgi:hypothetical protein